MRSSQIFLRTGSTTTCNFFWILETKYNNRIKSFSSPNGQGYDRNLKVSNPISTKYLQSITLNFLILTNYDISKFRIIDCQASLIFWFFSASYDSQFGSRKNHKIFWLDWHNFYCYCNIGNRIVYSEIFNSEGKSDLKHWTTVLDGQFRFPCCQFWTVYPQTLVFYNLLQYVPSETQEQQ